MIERWSDNLPKGDDKKRAELTSSNGRSAKERDDYITGTATSFQSDINRILITIALGIVLRNMQPEERLKVEQ